MPDAGLHHAGLRDTGASDPSFRDPGEASAGALALAREMGLSFTVADVLFRRGHQAGAELERYLDPKLAHLTKPDAMADLDPAAERIARAIRERERICVFGDYDCDGITSTAILTEVIGTLGGNVTPLLASRFAGGYGFSAPALQRVKDAGATLLVTCDCGSSDHERLEAARHAGIDAVVIDHHLVPDQPLPAVAFLNPHRPSCGFPYKGLASCGLALFVAARLRTIMDKPLDVRRWLDLVAIGTIADVAPLTGDNRALVRAGLKTLLDSQRVGLKALMSNANKGRNRPMSAEDVAYQIAPRINAAGRLTDPMLALRALVSQDASEAWKLAEELEELSVRRRTIQRVMIEQATREIERRWSDAPALVVAHADWHPGVVGIVAGRLADRYRKPAIVIALEGTSGRGSARAPNGFRLYDSLKRCGDVLTGFGGHQAAAGVELESERVDAFRDVWSSACAEQLVAAPLPTAKGPDVRFDSRDDLMTVVADLERIEPCGEANPGARIWFGDVDIRDVRAIGDHAKLSLDIAGQRVSAFWPDGANQGAETGTVRMVGRLKRDLWGGGQAAEIIVSQVQR